MNKFIRFILRWVFIKRKTSVRTRMVYVDAANNFYYEFTSPDLIPRKRLIAIQEAANYAAKCIGKDEYLERLDAYNKLFNAGKISEANSIIQSLKAQAELILEELSLLSLGAAMIVMNNEPEGESLYSWQEKKIAAWRADPKAYDFFLDFCTSAMSSSTTSLQTNIKAYLQTTEQPLMKIRHLVQSLSGKMN